MKRYAVAVLAMGLAFASTGMVAGLESVAGDSGLRTNGTDWTPQVESYVAQLVQNGVPSSGECPVSA
tara:strand:+ start:174 stop:374 length:201 start_codon:yes stop_codon:yes gene_type:complete